MTFWIPCTFFVVVEGTEEAHSHKRFPKKGMGEVSFPLTKGEKKGFFREYSKGISSLRVKIKNKKGKIKNSIDKVGKNRYNKHTFTRRFRCEIGRDSNDYD